MVKTNQINRGFLNLFISKNKKNKKTLQPIVLVLHFGAKYKCERFPRHQFLGKKISYCPHNNFQNQQVMAGGRGAKPPAQGVGNVRGNSWANLF